MLRPTVMLMRLHLSKLVSESPSVSMLRYGVGWQVHWNNPQDPSKGFKYLYLTDKDYQAIWSTAERPWIKAKPVNFEGAHCKGPLLVGLLCTALASCTMQCTSSSTNAALRMQLV